MSPPQTSATPSQSLSTAFVRHAEQALRTLADHRATVDAQRCIDGELGIPLPGMTVIQAEYGSSLLALEAVQDADRNNADHVVATKQAAHEKLSTWQSPDRIPTSVPWRSAIALRVRQGGVVAVLAAETMLLVDPINEILLAGIGYTPEGTSAALILTLLGGFMAHTRAEAIDTAQTATTGVVRESAEDEANRATLGLLFVAAAATLARVYASDLAEGGIEPSGITFFLVAQLVFLFAALSLPKSIVDTRRAINRKQLDMSTGDAADALAQARKARAALDQEHAKQPKQLAASVLTAHNAYLVGLADQHPSTWTADRLRAQITRMHRDGSLRAFVAEPAASTKNTSNGPDGGGGPGGPDSPEDGPPTSDPEESTTEARPAWTGYSSPEELLDDILGRRAS